MKTAYIIDAVRTPVGSYGGILSSMSPENLLAHVIRTVLHRNPTIDIYAVEDIIAGNVYQPDGDGSNVAGTAALLAGLPVPVAGNTVNRLDASGLQAVMDAARQVICGDAELIIACGAEHMSGVPLIAPGIKSTRQSHRMEAAENIARRWSMSREEQDEFALRSQQKYFAAKEAGKWEDEIVPVEVYNERLVNWIVHDENPQLMSREELAALKPALANEGTVTEGNSSANSDGAAAMLIAGEEAVKKFELIPMARVVSMAVAAVDPAVAGMAPVPAARKALQRAGLKINDIDLTELDEVFASQAIACIRELQLDAGNVNRNGGAIAIGHPPGCSGVRVAATLLHEMHRSGLKYGLAAISSGRGQGASLIFEKL